MGGARRCVGRRPRGTGVSHTSRCASLRKLRGLRRSFSSSRTAHLPPDVAPRLPPATRPGRHTDSQPPPSTPTRKSITVHKEEYHRLSRGKITVRLQRMSLSRHLVATGSLPCAPDGGRAFFALRLNSVLNMHISCIILAYSAF